MDRLTDEFRRRLRIAAERDGTGFGGDQAASNAVVSYTLFTDGVPDSKDRFEGSLKYVHRVGSRLQVVVVAYKQ